MTRDVAAMKFWSLAIASAIDVGEPHPPAELVTGFQAGWDAGAEDERARILALIRKECPYLQNGSALADWLEGKLK